MIEWINGSQANRPPAIHIVVLLQLSKDMATHPQAAKDKTGTKTVSLTCRLIKMVSLQRETSFQIGGIIQAPIGTISCKNKKDRCLTTQTTTTTSTMSRRNRTSRWTCKATDSRATVRTTCSRLTQDTDKQDISRCIILEGSRVLLIKVGIITVKGK